MYTKLLYPHIFMLSCVSLALEAVCKEIKDPLLFRTAVFMQTTVIAQGNKTAVSKARSSPVTQKSPEKVSTHSISP